MKSKLETWAENLQKEVYSEYTEKYSFWKPGLKVFYSPVVMNPHLMIISYQPGGTEKNFEQEEKSFFEKGDFQLPTLNEYSETDYIMSRKIRSFFDFDGGLDLLKSSVVFPLIFFRAPKISIWRKDNSKKTRHDMEEFSFSKVTEIIEKLQPQRILVLGIETYDQLKNILGSFKNEKILHTRKDGNTRMAVEAVWTNRKIFAVSHLSGSRISADDWEILQGLFENELSSTHLLQVG